MQIFRNSTKISAACLPPTSDHMQEPPRRDTASISLQNEHLLVSVLPAAGGNITELVDRRTGRNWLWTNPHIPATQPRAGLDYGKEIDSGGWDEILLSVSPDDLKIPGRSTRRIPDHGDLVRQAWSVLETDDSALTCMLGISGQLLNYRFERIVVLAEREPVIQLHYELTNNESFPWPWYWSAHALLSAEPGMQIELPSAQPFRLDDATSEHNPAERIRRWPDLDLTEHVSVDLSNSFAAKKFAHKIFVESPEDGSVRVAAPGNRETLTMSFDRGQLPWLGLWINNEGWSGCGSAPYRNLGLEPCTTPYDSVAEAIGNDAVDWIQPGEIRRWSLSVELTA